MLLSRKKEKQTCPRRMGEYGPWDHAENLDGWRKGSSFSSNTRTDIRSCNFCGSLNQDDFMRLVEEGVELSPTDKSYKVYLEPGIGKFYFQHLSVEQRKKFVDMLNEKRVVIGYPGRFYVRPFFVSYE